MRILLAYCLFFAISISNTFGSPPPTGYYWVGGTGNWSDIANHWATSSGGNVFHLQVPTSTDDVFFDNNSFTGAGQVVTIDATTIFFHNMDWTGALFNPQLSAPSSSIEMNVFGSFTLIAPMNFNSKGSVIFIGNSMGNTITSAGQIFQNEVQFKGVGGGWTLQDALTLNGAAIATNTGLLTLSNGIFNTNSQSVTCLSFLSSNTNVRTLIMDNSLMTLTASSPNTNHVTVWNTNSITNLTLSATGSTIQITSPNRPAFFSAGKTYNNVIFTSISGVSTLISGSGMIFNGDVTFSGSGTVTGGNTFNGALNFVNTGTLGGGSNICNGTTTFSSNASITSSNTFNGTLNFSAGKIYTLTSATTQTIGASGTLTANGTCTATINIESSLNGTQATISKVNGNLDVDQVIIQDIAAIVTASFSANATNSIDAGNCTGWNFPPSSGVDMYWINGAGNWTDPTHWSLSSGGAPGTCIPGPGNNVFFNSNSFTSLSKTVTVNAGSVSCKNMDWTGAGFTPTFATTASSNRVKIFGSLVLISAMTINSQILSFESRTSGNTITTAGKSLPGQIFFNGLGGTWTLLDN